MTNSAETIRRYRVHARHVDRHHARLVEEVSFEAAAVAYLENLDISAATDDQEISIIVHDVSTGHEHCFRLDLGSGETSPCG
jgi:hypothetical protein